MVVEGSAGRLPLQSWGPRRASACEEMRRSLERVWSGLRRAWFGGDGIRRGDEIGRESPKEAGADVGEGSPQHVDEMLLGPPGTGRVRERMISSEGGEKRTGVVNRLAVTNDRGGRGDGDGRERGWKMFAEGVVGSCGGAEGIREGTDEGSVAVSGGNDGYEAGEFPCSGIPRQ